MDPEQALADLMEISSQIDAAVILAPDGAPLASSLPPERATALARAAAELLDAGDDVTQVEAATRDGNLFAVRDGSHAVAAVTGTTPTVALVLYDLRTCLRGLAAQQETEPPPKRRRKKREDADAPA